MADCNNDPHKTERDDEYEVLTCIDDASGLFLVRRNADGEKLLGRALDWAALEHLRDLMELGAGEALTALLNHENLVSLAGTIKLAHTAGAGGNHKQLLLWDYCDGGTLDALFREPPVLATPTGFLPESLCWHVLRGLMCALAYLHDGYRRDWTMERVHRYPNPGERSEIIIGRRTMHEWIADPDWMPVLHRNVCASNVYFQQPRGSETYGPCKLGDFSHCYVSGHVNLQSQGPVATARRGDFVPLAEMKKRLAVVDVYTLPKDERPYTRGNDLFAVGALLYRMMTGRHAPDPEECDLCGCLHMDNTAKKPCKHRCHPAVDLNDPFKEQTQYTEELRDFVRELLWMNRADTKGAAELMGPLDKAFGAWREGTPDGRAFVEVLDDVREREERVIREMRKDLRGEGIAQKDATTKA